MVTVDGDHEPPPPPDDAIPFACACHCYNIRIVGRAEAYLKGRIHSEGNSSDETSLHRLWLDDKAGPPEQLRFPAYVSWDSGPPRESNNQAEEADEDVKPVRGPAWRLCQICGVKVYRTIAPTDGPQGLREVEVDLNSGILYGENLDGLIDAKLLLPFSSLSLVAPKTSNFGRPPTSNSPELYPATAHSGSASRLVPQIHDPFFLPPPFIPSHPYLRELCDQAVEYLNKTHARKEDEVRSFIAMKAHEMAEIEEDVRCEVDMLWTKYMEGPGRTQPVQNRSRSASVNRTQLSRQVSRDVEAQRAFSPPAIAPPVNGVIPGSGENPILAESVASPPYPSGTSLLAQSLSANAYQPPPPRAPPAVEDAIEHSLGELYKGRNSLNKEVAMSYAFSVLDESMGSLRRRSTSSDRDKVDVSDGLADVHNKDSWIETERAQMTRMGASGPMETVAEDGSADGLSTTPRAPRQAPERHPSKKGKEKQRVKFEEPTKDHDASPPAGDLDHEDYVFDFELEDGVSTEQGSLTGPHTQAVSPHRLSISRARNMVEANLSTTFAADAPSHRAAWRQFERNSSIYTALRREPVLSDEASTDDDSAGGSGFSKLATSMPVSIAMPVRARLPPKERKTSLSDRQGILVPPLMAAMREKGLDNAVPGSIRPSRADRPTRETGGRVKGSRSASVSREREQVKRYTADPGAVFESLADEGEDDSDVDEGQLGTLRDSRTFVPPHVLARRESLEQPDVGWRSMADQAR